MRSGNSLPITDDRINAGHVMSITIDDNFWSNRSNRIVFFHVSFHFIGLFFVKEYYGVPPPCCSLPQAVGSGV